jgi:bacillithiol system protein YtxJ
MAIYNHTIDSSDVSSLLQNGTSTRLIFKHSPYCLVSSLAFEQVSDFAKANPDFEIAVIDVVRQRKVSRQIAVELGLPHASPQAILMVGGCMRWHGSHGRITAKAIGVALESLTLPPAPLTIVRCNDKEILDAGRAPD